MGSVEIRVPQLTSNDATCILVEWLVAPGARVSTGDAVVTVETAKAAEELTCAGDGVLHPLFEAGAECAVGELIGVVVADEAQRQRYIESGRMPTVETAAADPATAPGQPGQVVTEPARRRMAELGVDPAAVSALDRKVIRVADIESLAQARPAPGAAVASPAGGSDLVALSPVQRAVAAVVAESHRTVPAAFVAVKVRVDAALAHARELTRQHRCLIGLTELVVKALGELRPRFPLCFAGPVDDGTVRVTDQVNVGITIDVGNGLHVPVIPDVAARPLPAVAKDLMRLRARALSGGFRAGELTGATIVLALHTEDDVSVAVPVVLPGTVCAVSLAGRQYEVDLDGSAVVRRTVVQLGLAYDHRVVNGREAVALLVAVRELVEHPERIPVGI
ncbi:2-oxo acid dehydrogenase subunit E2 [Rhizomonospora bruguierae]|uniref:2-oxo acid dehydrogenase subunit E2 n=1 Tax=Rhizomonospora bruguierae TaxID=1581705 RepID=UPI001BCECE67|nr:2-oxo acid dehydrogenase subunit E2 [Micromonospora sp. NBRC 107566]